MEPGHFDVFVQLRDELKEQGLELYLCNVPKRFERFFSSGRVQRELNVCSSKQELFQQLASKPTEQPDGSENGADSETRVSEVAPIPVTLSTREGIRLFEGYATNLDRERRIHLETDDHSAASLPSDFDQELQLTFNSQVLQMAPPPVVFEACSEAEDTNHRYRVLVGLRNLDNQQQTLLEEYFHTSLN